MTTLSNFAFNLNLRPYTMGLENELVSEFTDFEDLIGGAVQVDPGFSQLIPRLLSTLETET